MALDEHCVLWDRTRDLALDHGFQMSKLCPMDAVCTGERCAMMEPIKKTADRLEKFYDTLDKHQTIVKLAKLREELKKLQTKRMTENPKDWADYTGL